MQPTLILPWFPIILAVAVAGRLLGRARGFGAGIACALFWVALVQASAGVAVWQQSWTVMSLLTGSLAIIFMGGWSGQAPSDDRRGVARTLPGNGTSDNAVGQADGLSCVSASIHQFDEWLNSHRDDVDPWPAFGEFLRGVLHQACQASHVHPFRLRGDEEELIALHATESLEENERRSARHGVPGHVITTGRPYLAGDPTHGELVHTLAAKAGEQIAWCFPITRGALRLGVVVVGRLDLAPERHRMLLRTVEQIVNQFWCTLRETQVSRSSAQRDPVSGLYTRPAFLRTAEATLRGSYRQGEPVALVVVAIEGLRELSDSGRWELADEAAAEMARSLREKLRTDDSIGRFDGSRFVLLLRRVDSALASLIVGQLVTRLGAVGGDTARWGAAIRVRCGVVGSGTEQPDLRSLVARALIEARRARETDAPLSSDLPEPRSVRRRLTRPSETNAARPPASTSTRQSSTNATSEPTPARRQAAQSSES